MSFSMPSRFIRALPFLTFALTACGDAESPSPSFATAPKPGSIPVFAGGPTSKVIKPTGKGLDVADDTNPPPRTRYRIEYHAGALTRGIPNVYFIWYGGWRASDITILDDFMSTVGSTPYFQIATLYPDASGAAPSGALVFGGQSADAYSHGSTISDADVETIIKQQLAGFGLPQDPDGIYVVLASADVWESSGLDVTYCAFHGMTTYNGGPIRYAFVGDPARSPQRCAPQGAGPNGSLTADGVASLLAAELFNVVTDPDFNEWYDRLGLEGADKCVWSFGATTIVNGAQANVHLGQRDFLLQQLWVPSKSGGACGLTR
jgi:hypothetical protein